MTGPLLTSSLRGRGFTIRGNVVDTAALAVMAGKVAGFGSTVITLVLSLQPIWATSTQLQLCGLSPGLHAYVTDCVSACPAQSIVNASLVIGNCTAVPSACVACITPALSAGTATSYYV